MAHMAGQMAMSGRRLSPHFHSDEFISRDGVVPPTGWLNEMAELCRDYLEPLRLLYGPVTVVSGFRSANHNASVGGARASRHLDLAGAAGAAADITCRRGKPADWFAALDRMGCPGLGRYPTHVHADNRMVRARW